MGKIYYDCNYINNLLDGPATIFTYEEPEFETYFNKGQIEFYHREYTNKLLSLNVVFDDKKRVVVCKKQSDILLTPSMYDGTVYWQNIMEKYKTILKNKLDISYIIDLIQMLFGDYYLQQHEKYQSIYGRDTCVLMQCGHFFEVYAVDNDQEKINAEGIRRLSDIMNIQLTRKNKKIEENNRKNLLMIGIPLHAIEKYLTMLLNANFTAIVIEQISDPPDPERKVTGIYSPGTNMEYNMKTDSNNLMTLYIDTFSPQKMFIGMSVVDVSTGKCEIYETYSREGDKNFALDDAYRYLKSVEPSEIIIYADGNFDCKINYLEIEGVRIHKRDKVESKLSKLSFQDAFLKKLYPNTGMLSVLEYLGLEHYPFATFLSFQRLNLPRSQREYS